MKDVSQYAFRIFDIFKNGWALAAAGSPERHNGCTVSWGSMGTMWTRPGGSGDVLTVYLHPGRYTQQLFRENGLFTVSFFGPEHKEALAYMGSRSGRSEDKEKAAGLTPMAAGGSIGYEEAELIFVCRKLYGAPFEKDAVADDVRDYYISHPAVYPPDENGNWQPHWQFVGEIIEVIDRR